MPPPSAALKGKRLFSVLLSVTIILLFAAVFVSPVAADTSGTCGEGLTWSFDESTGTLTISGTGEMTNYDSGSDQPWETYKSDLKTIIFEEGITRIGKGAFLGYPSLESIGEFPSTLETIGPASFMSCNNLSGTLSLGTNLQSVEPRAFVGTKISGYDIAENHPTLKFENGILYSKNGEKLIHCLGVNTGDFNSDWLKGVTIIGEGAFRDCKNFNPSKLVIPDTVTSIEKMAFQHCPWITGEVKIPDSVEGNLEHVFNGATGITKVTIGENLDGLGTSAFNGCTSLSEVDWGKSTITSISTSAFSGCTSLATLPLPDSLTSIENYAFQGCSGLTTILLPASESITIKPGAFKNCPNLGDIVLGENIVVSNEIFTGATLQSLTFNAPTLTENALTGATIIGTVTLGNGVETITISNLENRDVRVIFNSGVKKISNKAFIGTNFIHDLSIPSEVTISGAAFYGANLKNVTYNAAAIPDYAFQTATMDSFKLGSNVANIGQMSFEKVNTRVIDLTDMNTDITIGSDAFANFKATTIIYVKDTAAQTKLNSKYANSNSVFAVTNDGIFVEYDAYTADGTLSTPSKPGYKFIGWYESSDFSGTSVTEVTAGKTYYAKWEEATTEYTITPETATHVVSTIVTSNNADVEKAKLGTTIDVLATAETGYEISEILITDSSEKIIAIITGASGSFSMPESNVKVTATAKAVQYTITYSGAEIAGHNNPETYTTEILPIILNDPPVREGFTFDGWYDENNVEVTQIQDLSDKNLVAKWTRETYTIKWLNDDGSVLRTDSVDYKDMPYYGTNPTKESTAQSSYTFEKWIPDVTSATGNIEYKAVFKENTQKYTVKWVNYDDSLLEEDADVAYGTLQTYDGDTPTKPTDANYYVFAKWNETVETVKGDKTYKAEFTAIPVDDPNRDENEPVLPISVIENGDLTNLTTVGSEKFIISSDGKSASLKDENDVVTLIIEFAGNVGTPNAEVPKLSGEIVSVKARYEETKAAGQNGSELPYTLELILEKLTHQLPQIDSTFKTDIANAVKQKYPRLQPGAMISADGSTITIANGGIKITFTVPTSSIFGKVWHIHATTAGFTVEEVPEGNIIQEGDKTHITVNGDSFSTHGIAFGDLSQPVDEKPSSSTPQGSSVWLTETQTQTPTPTETQPEQVPTTQPTPTQTEAESPLSILGVLAGLGAVATLRRR